MHVIPHVNVYVHMRVLCVCVCVCVCVYSSTTVADRLFPITHHHINTLTHPPTHLQSCKPPECGGECTDEIIGRQP